MLHIVGSVCYVHINSQRKKLDNKFVVGAFLRYDYQSKVFCIYIPTSKKNHSVQDVKFDESKFFFQKDFLVIFISTCGSICFSSFGIRVLQCCSYSKPNLGYSRFKFTSCWGSSYVFFNTSSRFPWDGFKFFNTTTITTIQTFYFPIWSASCSIKSFWWLSRWSNQTSRIDFISASCLECQSENSNGWQNQINLQ